MVDMVGMARHRDCPHHRIVMPCPIISALREAIASASISQASVSASSPKFLSAAAIGYRDMGF